MENMSLDQLNADPKNPRTINNDQFNKLKELLKEFGDLSGIVKNTRTGVLVGGHMRVNAFKADGNANIQITQRFDMPTETGTTAMGYVVLNGEPFTYREVDWDEGKQRAANLAANKAGGQFDNDLLAEVMYELSQLENGDELIALTGFNEEEAIKLLNMTGFGAASEDDQGRLDQMDKIICPECGHQGTASEFRKTQA